MDGEAGPPLRETVVAGEADPLLREAEWAETARHMPSNSNKKIRFFKRVSLFSLPISKKEGSTLNNKSYP